MSSSSPAFVSEADSLGEEGNKFVDIISGKEILKVSINVSTVPLASDKIRIITIEDVQSQVEGKEAEAWLRLMRILMHEINDIFIPFYSTKKEGSGIGLVLARQIMIAHQGSIRVKSEPGRGSSFFLWFEK